MEPQLLSDLFWSVWSTMWTSRRNVQFIFQNQNTILVKWLSNSQEWILTNLTPGNEEFFTIKKQQFANIIKRLKEWLAIIQKDWLVGKISRRFQQFYIFFRRVRLYYFSIDKKLYQMSFKFGTNQSPGSNDQLAFLFLDLLGCLEDPWSKW